MIKQNGLDATLQDIADDVVAPDMRKFVGEDRGQLVRLKPVINATGNNTT